MALVMRRRGVRLLALAAIISQVLVALISPFVVPIAVGAVIGGVTGLRLVRRDADAAVLRFGLGFLASLLSTGIGILGFAVGLLVPAALSSVLFGLTWWSMQRLARAERLAWGATFRGRIDRRPDEEQRGPGGRVPPPPPDAAATSDEPQWPQPPAASEDVSDDASDDDGTAWWEELD